MAYYTGDQQLRLVSKNDEMMEAIQRLTIICKNLPGVGKKLKPALQDLQEQIVTLIAVQTAVEATCEPEESMLYFIDAAEEITRTITLISEHALLATTS